MKHPKNNSILIVLISFLAITIPLFIYIFNFSRHSISNKPNDWTNFATYFASFVSLANLIVFVYFTRLVYLYSLTRDKILDDFERPIISFSKLSETDRYTIENVGKGAALNIEVKSHLDKSKSLWLQKRLTYSFQSGMSKTMNWTTDCNALCANYHDIFGNEYISYFENDKLVFIDLQSEKIISQYSNELRLSKFREKETLWFS